MLYCKGARVIVVSGSYAGRRGTVMRVIGHEDVPGQGQYLTVKIDGEDDLLSADVPWYPHFMGSSLLPTIDQ